MLTSGLQGSSTRVTYSVRLRCEDIGDSVDEVWADVDRFFFDTGWKHRVVTTSVAAKG